MPSSISAVNSVILISKNFKFSFLITKFSDVLGKLKPIY